MNGGGNMSRNDKKPKGKPNYESTRIATPKKGIKKSKSPKNGKAKK
jgi:hypothetical protein